MFRFLKRLLCLLLCTALVMCWVSGSVSAISGAKAAPTRDLIIDVDVGIEDGIYVYGDGEFICIAYGHTVIPYDPAVTYTFTTQFDVRWNDIDDWNFTIHLGDKLLLRGFLGDYEKGEVFFTLEPGCSHQYIVETIPPTCTKDGLESTVCTLCGIGYGSSIPATGHQFENDICIICGSVSHVTLSGNVHCFGNGKVTLILTGTDTVETLTTVDGEFDFTTKPGPYTLTVYKSNHTPREYQVTLLDTDLVMDVKLHLIGDIDGNDKVSMGDLAKLYAHLKSTNPINDPYQLLCANINGGSLNLGDVATLYAHIKGSSLLY